MDHSEFFIAKQAELWDRFIKNVHKCKDCPSLVKAGESDDVSIALKAKTLSCALLEPEFQLILPPGCPRKGTFELADNIANHLRRLIASYGVAATSTISVASSQTSPERPTSTPACRSDRR